MVAGVPERGSGQRAEHAQLARRAVRELPGRVRRAPRDGGDSRGLPRRLRRLPKAARRPRASDGAGCAVRLGSGSRGDADVLHPPGVQGRLRHEGHADDDGGRHRLRDGRAPRRRDHRRSPAGEGRHRLRQGQRDRVQRRHRESRRIRRSDRPVPGIRGAEHVGRAGLQPLRHRALAAGLELGVGRRGLREPRHLRLLRADGRVVQGAGVAQRHRQPADDQGADPLRRRRRVEPPGGPRGHQLPHRPRYGPRAGRPRGSRPRLLRSQGHLHGGAGSTGFRRALRRLRRRRRSRRRGRAAAGRHAHRDRPRVHGQAHLERRGDQRPDRRRDQDRPPRPPRGGPRRVAGRAPSRRSRRARHGLHVPGRAGRDPADPHARALLQDPRRRPRVRGTGSRRHVEALPRRARGGPRAPSRAT